MEESTLGISFPAFEPEYRNMRLRSAIACEAFNALPETASMDERAARWNEIVGPSLYRSGANGNPISLFSPGAFPAGGAAPYVKAPFWCDYGTNLHIGRTTFINRGCKILDTPVQPVRIGEKCLFGPDVHIYAVSHAEDRDEVQSPSYGKAVVIGDRCWIGGRTTILGGVTIGDGCIIGAGSVVTKSVPADHIAYGTPARVYRKVSTAGQKPGPTPLISGIPVEESSWWSGDLAYASVAASIALAIDAFLNPASYVPVDEAPHARGPVVWLLGRMRFAGAIAFYVTVFVLIIRMYRAFWP